MAHGDKLTTEEYSKRKLNGELARYLEAACRQLGLQKSDIRVIDWGTGRGINLLLLRERGYTQVWGVDIDQAAIERGRDFFAQQGLELDDHLRCLDENGCCDLPDSAFHFVFSLRVFEHVRDIETTVAEISRITMPGGLGLHIYPGHQLPVEGHLHMPFIHWLPKNEARRKLIKAYTYLGVEPEWQWNEGQPRGVRAQRYINFSFNSTFYRHYDEVGAVFERHGLRTRFVGMDHPTFRRGAFGRLSRIGPARDLLNWVLLNFKTVEIATEKR